MKGSLEESPGHQGRDDICDGGIELSQHLLHRSRNRQLLTKMLSPPDLLSVLPDDLSQLLTPGCGGPQGNMKGMGYIVEDAG